jgi:FkbM family methyltransferase
MKKLILTIINYKPINYCVLLITNILKLFIKKDFLYKFPVNRTFTVKLNVGKSFWINSNGHDIIAKEIYWKGVGSYEPDTIKLFTNLVRNSNCFFDIGANTGIFSLIACSMINHQGIQVHSFEPISNVYHQLLLNKKINGFDNLHINNIALSNFEGEHTFYMPVSSDYYYMPLGSSSRSDHLQELRKIEIKVNVTMLDTYIKSKNLEKLDLIKIDTEGTEHLVFAGGLNSLNKFRPVIISEVLDGLNEPQMQDILDKFGYKYFNITNKGLVNRKFIKGDRNSLFKNYLFIQEKDVEKFLSNINLIY